MQEREGLIGVPGGKVWYRLLGEGASGNPLLVLHGGPGGTHDYVEPVAALADERPVVFYDQLGSGRSDRPQDDTLWTLERFVEELAQVRSTLELSHVHLLGQSWGGMLAVEYMLRGSPDGVISLVLSGPCLNAQRWAADQRRYLEHMPADIRETIAACEATGDFTSPAYQAAMDAFYRCHLCRLDPWPDCLNRTFEKMGADVYTQLWGPSEFTVLGSLREYDRTNDLKDINIPTLFTCGRYDEATPEATQEYHRNLPGSEIAIFEDASHEHHLERTQDYLDVVRGFLRRVEDQDKSLLKKS